MKLTRVLFLVTSACFAQSASDVALRQIRPETLEAHMRFLADDLLEGRGTGSRGYEIAAKYVAAQFQALRLQAAGKEGSYFQPVSLRQVQLVPEQSSVTLIRNGHEEPLVFEKDFLMRGQNGIADDRVSAPLVFVGFGIEAPEFGYNEYAGLDVRGKIVVMFHGAPSAFPAGVRAHFRNLTVKFEHAAAHGATGAVILWAGEGVKHLSFEAAVNYFRSPLFCWLSPDGTPSDYIAGAHSRAIFSKAASARLFEGSPKTFEQVMADADAGKPQGFPLAASLAMREAARYTPITSPNVVALLRGSDPKLRDEYVVFSAHLDHMGIGPPASGDAIYNGAEDNASGVSALIEIARAFARLPNPPRRSILFLAVTGEESGLLGSDFFVRYPTVPKNALVANVNMDEVALNYDFRDVVALGEEHSSLGKLVREAARQMNLEVSPDPQPEQAFFARSDQYSFVRQGVPSVSIGPGFKTVDPQLDGKKITSEWEEKIYHTPKDDMSQPLNFTAAVRMTRLNFLVGYLAAQADERPRWNPGDFFGKTFGGQK